MDHKHPKIYSVPFRASPVSVSLVMHRIKSLRPGQGYLCESSGGHLHPAFVRGVDLQVVAVRAVQAQEAAAWKPCIVTWKITYREELHNELITVSIKR